jgi:hypothetical protein
MSGAVSERILLHDDPLPDAVQDLILGDEMPACSHQHPENIERTVPERNRYPVDNEFAPIREQLAVAEADDGGASLRLSIFRWRLVHIRSNERLLNPYGGSCCANVRNLSVTNDSSPRLSKAARNGLVRRGCCRHECRKNGTRSWRRTGQIGHETQLNRCDFVAGPLLVSRTRKKKAVTGKPGWNVFPGRLCDDRGRGRPVLRGPGRARRDDRQTARSRGITQGRKHAGAPELC